MRKLTVILATIAFAASAFAAGSGKETGSLRGAGKEETFKAREATLKSMENVKSESELMSAIESDLASSGIEISAKDLIETLKGLESYKGEKELKEMVANLKTLNSSSSASDKRYFKSVIGLVAKAREFGVDSAAGKSILTMIDNVGSLMKMQGDGAAQAVSTILGFAYGVRTGKNAITGKSIESKSNEELVDQAADIAIERVYPNNKDKKEEFKIRCLGKKA